MGRRALWGALQPLEPTGCELMQLVGLSWFCKKGFLIYPLWQQLPCSHIGCPVMEHTLETLSLSEIVSFFIIGVVRFLEIRACCLLEVLATRCTVSQFQLSLPQPMMYMVLKLSTMDLCLKQPSKENLNR